MSSVSSCLSVIVSIRADASELLEECDHQRYAYRQSVSIRADASELREAHAEGKAAYEAIVSIRADASELLEAAGSWYWRSSNSCFNSR